MDRHLEIRKKQYLGRLSAIEMEYNRLVDYLLADGASQESIDSVCMGTVIEDVTYIIKNLGLDMEDK